MTTLSFSSAPTLSLFNNTNNKPHLSLNGFHHKANFLTTGDSSISNVSNPLRVSINHKEMVMVKKRCKEKRSGGTVCYAAPLTASNLQWISIVSSGILMLAKGTGVQKSFLVLLFALQAPISIISWIKGDYGIWTAFLALLVRLFFFIPGELELPSVALLMVIVAPHQVMQLRGRQAGAITSLMIAGYLAFQHFSRAGSLKKAFDQGSIIATIAIICITAVSCLLII